MVGRSRYGLPALAAVAVLAALLLRPGAPRAPRPRLETSVVPTPGGAWGSVLGPARRESQLAPRATVDRRSLGDLGRAAALGDERCRSVLLDLFKEAYCGDVPALIEALRSPDMMTAVGAAEMLARCESEEAIPPLVEALRTTRWFFLKRAAITAIGLLSWRGPSDDVDRGLRGVLEIETDPAVRALLLHWAPFWSSWDPNFEATALAFLRGDPDPEVRAAAAVCVSRHMDAEAVHALLGALEAESRWDVRVAIIEDALRGAGDSCHPLSEVLARIPGLDERRRARWRVRHPTARYEPAFSPGFFGDGGPRVRFDAAEHRRIGIKVSLTPTESPSLVAARLLSHAPLDRYRDFFYFRRGEEFAADVEAGKDSPRAYDDYGSAIPGGLPITSADERVILRFVDPCELPAWAGGLTVGEQAFVTAWSLEHEFGHALGRLADEYSQSSRASDWGVNLATRGGSPLWLPLARQGILPAQPVPRMLLDAAGRDVGKRVIPSTNCFMNNLPTDNRYCPVCQLELIARICELTGAPVPW